MKNYNNGQSAASIIEIWKDVIGYEGYYRISNYGRVLSVRRAVKTARGFRTVNERILKTTIDKYGYEVLVLRKFNTDKHYTIHRLVAIHFIDNLHNLPVINHLDEDKLNNKVSNLEWCTVDYNNKYNDRQEKINLLQRENCYSGIPVIVEKDGIIMEFKSGKEASRHLKIQKTTVYNYCKNIVKSKKFPNIKIYYKGSETNA